MAMNFDIIVPADEALHGATAIRAAMAEIGVEKFPADHPLRQLERRLMIKVDAWLNNAKRDIHG